MTPVLAWCERCGGGFPLFAMVQQGTGACPHCRQPLGYDPTAGVVEWAAVVDADTLPAGLHSRHRITERTWGM